MNIRIELCQKPENKKEEPLKEKWEPERIKQRERKRKKYRRGGKDNWIQ